MARIPETSEVGECLEVLIRRVIITMNLAAALIAHLIGDYLLQTDRQAEGKKRSSWICTEHVMAYMLPMLLVGATPLQLGLIATQHWIQDRTALVVWFMRHTGHKKFMKPPLAPWSIIITDNALHLAWVWLVAVAF